MKTEITKEEYYQLAGLSLLAKKKMEEVTELIKMGMKIVGEEDEHGTVADAFYSGDPSADEILSNIDIEVEDHGNKEE